MEDASREALLSVSIPTLRVRFPNECEEILALTQSLLATVSLANLTVMQCAEWGMAVQSEYGRHVQAAGIFTSDRVVVSALKSMARINDILLELADAMLPQTGFAAVFKKRKDFWGIFARRSEEIAGLCAAMKAALPCLQNVCDGLTRLDEKSAGVQLQLSAGALASQYLADLVADDVARNALIGRSAALFQTRLRMAEADAMRDAARFTYRSLAERIQEIILLTLPAWVERIRMLAARKNQDDLEFDPVRKDVSEMIERLNK